MKKITVCIIIVLIIINLTTLISSAESFYEYYFVPEDTERADITETEDYSKILNSLPDAIKEKLPDNIFSGNTEDIAESAKEITSFTYIWDKILDTVSDSLMPSLKSAAIIIEITLLAAIFRSIINSIGDKSTGKTAEAVFNAGITVAIMSTELISIETVERFNELICGLMNGMVPILGVIFAASGNAGTAAVQSGGIMLLVTLCQNLFGTILLPSVRICLILSIAGAVFPDIGIRPVSTAFRNITTWIMVVSVTLFSFMLGLQNTIAQSADTFGARSIKFAIGNLIPIIGGAVSDSLGTIGGSLSVLKSAGGASAIVVIIVLLMPAVVTLVFHRFALFICKTISGILGCSEAESLLGDMGSISSMLLAFAAAMSIAFIYALTLFTGANLAILS